MNFKTFFYLKESPDEVYTNDGKKLTFAEKDARTFGWFSYIEDVEPFLMCSLKGNYTHVEMYEDFFEYISKTKNRNVPPTKINIFVPNFKKVINQLKKSKRWKSIVNRTFGFKKEEVENLLDPKTTTGSSTDPFKVENQIGSFFRVKVFTTSGRFWVKSNVISFWNKQGEVSKERISELLDIFGKSFEETYIDVVDPNNLHDEEKQTKVLPTVEEYFARPFDLKKSSKEEEKKYKEFLAKKHIATDPKERKKLQDLSIGDTEREWGSTKVAKDTPLIARQKAFTSESKINAFTFDK